MIIEDMPKLESPFVRANIQGNFIVIDKIAKGFEWVFEDESVMAVEKLHGTNVSIVIENGRISRIFNRTEEIPFFNKEKLFIIEGIMNAYDKGWCNYTDGQYFGELIGEKLHSNPYKIKGHLWVPFNVLQRRFYYKSWGKYSKDFSTISEWFKKLIPLFSLSHGIKENGFVEGIIFTHPDGRMAKLRRDMFDWFEGKRHKETSHKNSYTKK